MYGPIEELLSVIAEIDEEDDLLVKIHGATWAETSLELRVKVSVEISAEDCTELGEWTIRCEHLLAHGLRDQSVPSLELVDDHPLLWEFKYPTALAFFRGVPANSEACVGALYEAHKVAAGPWLRFGEDLNPHFPTSEILSTGYGLLARAPMPLLRIYAETLLPHGVDVNIVVENHVRLFDEMTRNGKNAKALLLGASYVIGTGWTAQRSDG